MANKYNWLAGVATVAATAVPLGAAQAQTVNQSALYGADSAFILPNGAVSFGGTLTDPRGGVSGAGKDGDLALSFGLGNPIDAVGVQLDMNITGTDPVFDSGAFNIKVARSLYLSDDLVVFGAVTASNLAPWGDAEGEDVTWTGTVTGMTEIATQSAIYPVMMTVGYGSNTTLLSAGQSDTGEGMFAGVGVGVAKYLGVSVSGTENQLNAGVSIGVPGVPELGITLGVNDVTDNMDRKQKTLSVSYTLTDPFGGR
ncbi:hypothetical protein DL237_19965 [Pseudooceanicola sediminis]|uniref:Porin n=1 Tax=Pseudooceanicola sediminis TaxID=2211117 RepID=A0A399IVE7_9RHOB|nr:hypothetical protein [Pseudooceanicola sediminis]KAA2311373.1 hypothetical protein E0K93_20800 [Puniceibacterium sp. HSS470]RII36920.1 hypothetical protein DL237_19965 [Pseudooceanicola sediminis]|tara:strand:+ start:4866 stop:5630 length:765 start_codon:yes stop_codon:yes gene_type:complete